MQAQQAIMGALAGSTKIMSKINEDMNVSEIRDVLKEFNKQMGKAEMNGEMVNDAFDMMEDPNAQGDADEVYESIMGEIGLELEKGGTGAGIKAIPKKNAAQQEEQKEEVDDMEARLAALKM